MRAAYTADQIRAAEQALMALLPEGALMRRAATGLARVCAALLAKVYGARVLLLVGSGDNGVDAPTGVVAGVAVQASVTVTMGACKVGLLVDPGAGYVGQLELVEIGLGPYLPEPAMTALTDEDVRGLLPRPGAESDKYRRGVVGIAAGSDTFTGAAVLAVGGALRAGAGMVRYVGTAGPAGQVRTHWPEAVVTELERPSLEGVGQVQAWALGPGLGTCEWARALTEEVLRQDVPVLVDADALTLAPLRGAALITPHAGELSRLLGVPRTEIETNRLEHVRRAAAELGVTVLLQGS